MAILDLYFVSLLLLYVALIESPHKAGCKGTSSERNALVCF